MVRTGEWWLPRKTEDILFGLWDFRRHSDWHLKRLKSLLCERCPEKLNRHGFCVWHKRSCSQPIYHTLRQTSCSFHFLSVVHLRAAVLLNATVWMFMNVSMNGLFMKLTVFNSVKMSVLPFTFGNQTDIFTLNKFVVGTNTNHCLWKEGEWDSKILAELVAVNQRYMYPWGCFKGLLGACSEHKERRSKRHSSSRHGLLKPLARPQCLLRSVMD